MEGNGREVRGQGAEHATVEGPDILKMEGDQWGFSREGIGDLSGSHNVNGRLKEDGRRGAEEQDGSLKPGRKLWPAGAKVSLPSAM